MRWNISRLYQVRIKINWLHSQRTMKFSLEMNWYSCDVWFNVSARQILALILIRFAMNNSDFICKMSLSTNRGAWKTKHIHNLTVGAHRVTTPARYQRHLSDKRRNNFFYKITEIIWAWNLRDDLFICPHLAYIHSVKSIPFFGLLVISAGCYIKWYILPLWDPWKVYFKYVYDSPIRITNFLIILWMQWSFNELKGNF